MQEAEREKKSIFLCADDEIAPKKRRLGTTEEYNKKIDEYLRDEPGNHTHDHGILGPLYIHYNTALPTSAPAECLFSAAGRIFVPGQSMLSDQNFEMLTFVTSNWHLCGPTDWVLKRNNS